MSRELLGVGLAGTGTIGLDYHAPAIQLPESGARLVATADPRPRKIEGILHVPDFHELLSMKDIDIIDIATPPGTHNDFVMAAIAAGKHVMVEKPHFRTMDQLKAAEKAAEEAGVVMFTACHSIYRPEVLKAAEILQGLTIVELIIYYHQLFSANTAPWLQDQNMAFGGITWDHGFNGIAAANRMAGNIPFIVDPQSVSFDPRPSSGKVEHYAEIGFTFGNENQGRGLGIFDWSRENQRDIKMRTAEGRTFMVDLIDSLLIETTRGESVLFEPTPPLPREIRMGYEYPRVIEHLVKQVLAGESYVRGNELKLIADATAIAG